MHFETRYKSHHNSSGLIGKYYPQKRLTEQEFLNKLKEEPKDVPRAIYVHTPYCDKICSFCNLNREQLSGSLDSYADYIVSEFDKYGEYRYFKEKSVDVIYFGGGTPTVYKNDQLEKILKSVEKNIKFSSEYEFTLETTLHNLNDQKIDMMNKYGVNRLSVGIQSFSDEGRKFYNRTYSKTETIEKLIQLKEKFNGEVCIDIIYNYPTQRVEDAIEDAKIIKGLDLGSSSFYSLMVHEGSTLSHDIKDSKVKIQDDLKREREIHDAFVKELTSDDNYYILELTKIAKKGRDKYKYIKTRNFGGDTFPIGVGAGGNVDNISVFRMKKEMAMFVEKSEYQQRLDKFSGLFQFPQIEKKLVNEILTSDEKIVFNNVISELKDNNFILEDETYYRLTEDGLFWGNNISREILTTIVEKTLG
ncbi:radical SAM protein [Candidatus Cetobacterium colombiensis]|uniref:Radical SAM protein n=1 Tax=Candidatus Cetobacterium colombiensis TaxID=3073100 RepID=A0ABU4W7F7_9FUSO|nr:radical SAM protein [Candidatus Cetobacterium colombiensis]MDX8335463.1 radical SAM protein [Candidatus Cetobacterium colombiensis]